MKAASPPEPVTLQLRMQHIESAMAEIPIKNMGQLCRATGIKRTTLWRMMSRRVPPSADVIASLATTLDLPIGLVAEIVKKEDSS